MSLLETAKFCVSSRHAQQVSCLQLFPLHSSIIITMVMCYMFCCALEGLEIISKKLNETEKKNISLGIQPNNFWFTDKSGRNHCSPHVNTFTDTVVHSLAVKTQ